MAQTQINELKRICEAYCKLTGKAPLKLEDLVTKPRNVENWRQLLEVVPKDPRENDYIYQFSENLVIITSSGASEEQSDNIILKFSTR